MISEKYIQIFRENYFPTFMAIIFTWNQPQQMVEGEAAKKQKVREAYLKVVSHSESEEDVKKHY